MIEWIKIKNHLDQELEIVLTQPEKTGFIVESIDGLGPVKGTINMTEIVTTDGSQYNSARLINRNIVIRFRFMACQTIEEVRLRSYKYFPIKSKVTFTIKTSNRIAEVEGYVESNEPDIFNASEGCIISILCPDSYFLSTEEGGTAVYEFSNVEPAFQFPVTIKNDKWQKTPINNDDVGPGDVLTEFGKHITFGFLSFSSGKDIIYSGDADVGIVITLTAIGPVVNPTIRNANTNEYMTLDTSILENGFGLGDTIEICTVKGNKYIHLIREGVLYNILNTLDLRSRWISLVFGDNNFYVTAETGSDNLRVSISHNILYEGV